MKASVIDSLLNHHPYYSKLSYHERLVVLNNCKDYYYSKVGKQICHAVYPKGSLGFDNVAFEPQEIVKLPQMMLIAKSLSKYSDVDYDLSTSEYLKEFTAEERTLIYRNVVAKISESIKDSYTVENMTGDLQISQIDKLKLKIRYKLFNLINLTVNSSNLRTVLKFRIYNPSILTYMPRTIVRYTTSVILTNNEILSHLSANILKFRLESSERVYNYISSTKLRYYLKTSVTDANTKNTYQANLSRVKLRFSIN